MAAQVRSQVLPLFLAGAAVVARRAISLGRRACGPRSWRCSWRRWSQRLLLWPVADLAAARRRRRRAARPATKNRPAVTDAASPREREIRGAASRPAPAAAPARRRAVRRWSLLRRCSRRALLLPAGRPGTTTIDARREQPDRDRPDRAEPRRDHRPQRHRARAELLGVHARDPAGAGRRPRRDDRRAGRDRRDPAARPQALPQAPGRVEELREPAVAHASDRRGGRALRGATAIAFRASRSRRGSSAAIRSARSARTCSATSAASTIGDVEQIANGTSRQLQGHRLHRQGRHRAVATSASCTARPASRRSRSMRAAARCARCRARRRCPGNNLRCRSTSAAGGGREPRSATGAARWSRSSPRPARSSRSSQARLRSEPLRRRHRRRELEGAQRVAGQAAAQPAAARRVSAGLDDQAVPGARRADARQAHADADDLRPGLLPAPATHRFRDDKPGGHGIVDMYKSIVVSCDTYYYVLANEIDIDDTHDFMTPWASAA